MEGKYMADDLKQFERYMIKNFGNNWKTRLDFLKYI
jgi:hypothetical protein